MDMREQNQKGIMKVSEDVIENIASVVALDTEGVHSMATSPVKAKNIILSSEKGKPILVNINGDIVSIDIYVNLKSGYRIKDVAEKLQKKVYTEIADMTSVIISKVNIFVKDVIKEGA